MNRSSYTKSDTKSVTISTDRSVSGISCTAAGDPSGRLSSRAAGFALRRVLPALLAALMIISQTACSRTTAGDPSAPEPVTGEDYLLDTICNISVYAMKDGSSETRPAAEMQDAAESAISDAFDLCASLDKTLSRTQPVSEISKVNEAGGEWVEVSDTTVELVSAGLKYSKLSYGDFDITIGGVTDLWDFHADPEDAKLPDEDELSEAVSHVDYTNVEIDGNRIRIKDPDARIDLGGIAKGYIGDRMSDLLEERGVVSGIVNLGGNVICIGGKYAGAEDDNAGGETSAESNAGGETGAEMQDFVIGVEAPFSDRTEIVGTVNGRDCTLVTSGIYERKIEVDGQLYHHILSTKTGYSAKTDVTAVTLRASKGMSMDIDALSTICLIKGSEQAIRLIEGMDGIEAVFILDDGSVRQTSGMNFMSQ